MSSDAFIRFEEGNWDELVEKFIDKYRDNWEEFIHNQYVDFIENAPEPLDIWGDR